MTPASLLGPDGVVAQRLERYEPRPQQLEMAEVADVARCPLCRAPLVFRMSCTGPKVRCLCDGSGMP